jgi:hypothetical protein
MNKLEEMFLTRTNACKDDLILYTDLTKDIALKYLNFWLKKEIEWFDNTEDGDVYKDKKGRKITENQLFNQFLKTL